MYFKPGRIQSWYSLELSLKEGHTSNEGMCLVVGSSEGVLLSRANKRKMLESQCWSLLLSVARPTTTRRLQQRQQLARRTHHQQQQRAQCMEPIREWWQWGSLHTERPLESIHGSNASQWCVTSQQPAGHEQVRLSGGCRGCGKQLCRLSRFTFSSRHTHSQNHHPPPANLILRSDTPCPFPFTAPASPDIALATPPTTNTYPEADQLQQDTDTTHRAALLL